MKSLIFSLPFAVFGASVSAAEFSVQRNYEVYDLTQKLADAACVRAFSAEVVPGFEGLTGAVLSGFDFFRTETGAIAMLSNITFQSEHLSATGEILCNFAPDGTVTDVIARFDGKGLGGFKRRGLSRPDSDPAGWTVTATQAVVSK